MAQDALVRMFSESSGLRTLLGWRPVWDGREFGYGEALHSIRALYSLTVTAMLRAVNVGGSAAGPISTLTGVRQTARV